MTEQRNAPDWERIEADYRAGLMSLREIAAPHGVTEAAIRKRAKRDGWERNLQAKIQAKADALVARRAVAAEHAKATEREIVEANAERIAQVRGEHRADITRARALALQLLDELEEQPELQARLRRALEAADAEEAERIAAAQIGLPGRVDLLKKLSETLRTLIGLEREAYGLDTAPDGGAPLFERIERVIVRSANPDA